MGRLRALVFDMDGVLIHSRALHVKAWDLFFRRHGVDFDSEFLMKKYFGRSNGEILKATLPPALADRDPVKLSQEKESLFREIANRELRPVAGLMEFLEYGRRVGLQMCVASSAPKENVEFVARRLKIGDYFEALIDDSCAPRAKPAPDLFLLAAQRLNAPAEQCMVFEDSH
ncbi:MAG: HAD family phosphatase, partial [bacterium]